jgi:phosphotransferase system HPr (HPr) family protein
MNRSRPGPAALPAPASVVEVEREVELAGELGLHARPAAAFADAAAGFGCELTVAKGANVVDAKSLLLLLTLDARRGDRLVIRGRGADALEAVDRLGGLLAGP